MVELTRRSFLKLGSATAGVIAVTGGMKALANADELTKGGKDYNNKTKKERTAIPSTCHQCVSTCGIIGYVENSRLVKIEGNPEHPNNRGTICAKGQAGVNQVYDPDRILYPMKSAGKRGEGKWKRISWEEAYSEIAQKMKAIRQSGHPEEFVFHYGRNRTNGFTDRFCNAFGTPSVFNHTAICEASKQVAQDFMWGKTIDVNDAANTKYMLNFGCNVYEAHVVHSSFVQRVIEGRVNNGAKLVTFDVRMSNTAGRSDEWFALKPGTDGIVALAMANVIMQEGLYDEKFITEWTNVTVDQLKNHLKQYTPEMAEKESGIPAKDIIRIAKEFGTSKPATTISYRGVSGHHNGFMNERCIVLLNAITGNVDVKGGYVLPQTGQAKDEPDPKPDKPKAKSGIKEYWKKEYPEASHGLSQTVLPLIKEGVQKIGLYMTYWYNPVYSNPQSKLQEEVLKDENLIPFFVAIDAYMSEATALADIILPESSYLERWDPEANTSYSIIPWISIRQPIIKPLGESKSIREIFMELAKRIGGGMETYFDYGSVEDYIKAAFKKNKGFEEDGGLEMLKKVGAWYDKSKKPGYKSYLKELKPEDLVGTNVDEKGYIFKEKQDGDKIVKEVIGIVKNGKSLKGFPIGTHKESPLFEIYSKTLEEHGIPGLPSYIPIPEHQSMKEDELILTTFKVAVHTQSRTANCKWLKEISHSNPLWIHPETAAKRGINNGDEVIVTSGVTSAKTKAHVTEGINPKVVAFSMGAGHWAYGRMASKAAKFDSKGAGKDVNLKLADPDTELIWWKDNGVHLNALVPVKSDPIGGSQAWMDTVVTVKRV